MACSLAVTFRVDKFAVGIRDRQVAPHPTPAALALGAAAWRTVDIESVAPLTQTLAFAPACLERHGPAVV